MNSKLITICNLVLERFGYSLSTKSDAECFQPDTKERFRRELELARSQGGEFVVIEELRDDSQAHPTHYINYECEFTSQQILKYKPKAVLDIGSYRHWLIGVLAHLRVSTIDIRERNSYLSNETVITGDINEMNLLPGSFDMVTSLSTIEHFGLGRYGDQFDLKADVKAVWELVRAIRPGGHFVFSVPITAGNPCLAFNSHRIYRLEMIRTWCSDLVLREERFIKCKPARLCGEEEISTKLGEFDVYCACYQKP